jgi:hypothetical protein
MIDIDKIIQEMDEQDKSEFEKMRQQNYQIILDTEFDLVCKNHPEAVAQ